MTTFSHCQDKISWKCGGQAQVTQLGYFAVSLSPGQPEKSTTTGTPSFSASRMVRRLVSWLRRAISAFGCKGSPWQLRALMDIPLSSSFFLNSTSAPESSNMESLQCGSPG